MKFLALATLAATLLCSSVAMAEMSTADMNKQIDQTNFLVNKGCSGTLIAKLTDPLDKAEHSYVLTANHCIMDQYEVVEHDSIDDKGKVTKEKIRIAVPGTISQIFFSGPTEIQRNSYVFKIKLADSALDLALLEVQSKLTAEPTTLACDDLQRGDKMFAVGNPYGVLYSSLTTGIVSSLQRSYRDLRIAGELGDLTDAGEHGLVQHSAPTIGGNSGGAIYNADGKFVGVHVRGGATGFGFAVPLSDVKKFLRRETGEELWKDCK